MRVKIIGSTESSRVIRSYLDKAGIAVSEHLPRFALSCTIHLSEHSGKHIIVDSVDSPLESHILRHITENITDDVILRRRTGLVSTENEIHLSVPAGDPEAAHAVEVGVLRGVQRAHFHRPWWRKLALLALLITTASIVPSAHAAPPRYSLFANTEGGTIHISMPPAGLFPQFQTGGGTSPCSGTTAPAHSFCGNNTGSVGAPAYVSLTAADLPGSITSNTSGLAATATALASTPSTCGPGVAAVGVLANGNATGCFTPGGLANPMTTLGDIIYGAASGTPTRLGANSTSTNNFLRSISSGVPSWGQVAFSDLSGSSSCAQEPALTGDITSSAGSCVTTLATTIPNAHTFTGNLTAAAGQNIISTYNINNVVYLDGNKYTTMAAAYAALGSTGGIVVVSPNNVNGTYSETWSSSLTMNKDNSGFLFMCPAVISMGSNQLIISAGVQAPFIKAIQPSTYNFPTVKTSVVFSYTGTGTAWSVGASTAATVFLVLENIQISLDSAGTAAVGVALNRVNNYDIRNVNVSGLLGTTTQQAWKLDGTGGYTGNGAFYNCTVAATLIAWQLSNLSSNNQFYGGQYFSGITGAIGFDFEGGNGNYAVNVDTEGLGTAVKFANNATVFDNIVWAYISGNTTDVSFGAASFKNVVYVAGGLGAGADPVVSDSSPAGSGNSVWNPLRYQMTSAGTMRANAGFTPVTAATGDLGSTALPFGNLWLGTAATNNFKFQPAATAAARVISMPDPLGAVNMPYVIVSGTSAMTTAAITTGACGTTVTTAATGAATTDSIEIARNAAPTNANGGNLILNWWVTSGNVNFNYCNPSAGSVTPTAMTINWRVIR